MDEFGGERDVWRGVDPRANHTDDHPFFVSGVGVGIDYDYVWTSLPNSWTPP